MSLNHFFGSPLAKTTTTNEDQDLFRQYLNLDEYDDDDCSDQLPSVTPPDPLPLAVDPTVSSFKAYSINSHPGRSVTALSVPIAPSTPLAPPIAGTLSVFNYTPTDNGMCDFRAPHHACSRAENCLNGSAPLAGASTSTCPPCGTSHVPRPVGLGTPSTYWNTRAATYTAGHGTVDTVAPCLGGHACIATVSPNVQPSLRVHPSPLSAHRPQTRRRSLKRRSVSRSLVKTI